jgi:hypothetical protein
MAKMNSFGNPMAREGINPIEALLLAAMNGYSLEEAGLLDSKENQEMLKIVNLSVAEARKIGAIIDIPS